MTSTSNEQPSDLPTKIGKPAQRALHGAGYTQLEQLTHVSEAELLKLHGMGPKALGIIRSALAEKGMAFANSSRGEYHATLTTQGE